MNKYSNGKIYIISSSAGNPYIGSTTLPLDIREGLHKQNGHLCSVKIHLGQPDFKMELLELYPCNSNEDLIKRERYWTEQINCCNKRRPYRSYAEQIQYQTEYFRTDYWRDYHKEYNKKREFRIKLLKVLPFYNTFQKVLPNI